MNIPRLISAIGHLDDDLVDDILSPKNNSVQSTFNCPKSFHSWSKLCIAAALYFKQFRCDGHIVIQRHHSIRFVKYSI